MFCAKCGTQNPDNSGFCSLCGSPLEGVETPVQPPVQQVQETETQPQEQIPSGMYTPPAYAPPVQNVQPPMGSYGTQPRSNHLVINTLKELLASPAILVAVIAYTAFLVLYIVTSIVSNPFTNTSYLYMLEDTLDIDLAMGSISGGYIIGLLVGSAPTIVMTIGMWLTFSAARNRNDNGMKTGGLTAAKVIQIIGLVGWCLFALLMLICSVIVIGGGVVEEEGAVAGVGFGILLIGGGLAALMVIYSAKCIKTVNAMIYTARTGNASDRVSGFVAVMSFLFALYNLLSILTGGFLVLLKATANICFGVFIFIYKSRMRKLMYPTPTYAPPAAPVNQEYYNYNR